MNEERKVSRQTIGMIIGAGFIVLMAICLFIAFGVDSCKEREEDRNFEARYIILKDEATGLTYEIKEYQHAKVQFPYDELVHNFSYVVYDAHSKKPTGQTGQIGRTVSAPGEITEEVCISHKNFKRVLWISIIMEEKQRLQPIMKFDPLDAIEVIDGEYYKYRYNGEYQYPLAYAEYDGQRLNPIGKAFIKGCQPDYAPNTSIAAPKEVGKYTVTFSISEYEEDPDLEIYNFVSKTITVEIVE